MQQHHQPTTVVEETYWIEPKDNVIHPWLTVLINFFVPGLGQVCIGQVGKGLGILVSFLLFSFITYLLMFVLIGFILWFFLVAYWVAIMVDGYYQADKLRKGQAIMKGECEYSFIKYPTTFFETGPTFVTTEQSDWPDEYRSRVGSTSHHVETTTTYTYP